MMSLSLAIRLSEELSAPVEVLKLIRKFARKVPFKTTCNNSGDAYEVFCDRNLSIGFLLIHIHISYTRSPPFDIKLFIDHHYESSWNSSASKTVKLYITYQYKSEHQILYGENVFFVLKPIFTRFSISNVF